MRRQLRTRKAWAKWRKLVSEQGGSGQSVAAFCRERALCRSHFFVWKKRLEQAAGPDAGLKPSAGREATLCPEARGAPLRPFVEVKLAPRGRERMLGLRSLVDPATGGALSRVGRAGDGRVEVVLKNGRSLWVGPGFDGGHVRALVTVLESEA